MLGLGSMVWERKVCNAEQQKTKSFMTPMVPAVVSVAFDAPSSVCSV